MMRATWNVVPLVVLLAACGGGSTEQPAATGSDRPPGAGASAPRLDTVLYVTNERAGTMTVIDPARGEAIGTVTLGKRPRGIVATADGSRVYVALSGSPIAGPGVDESTLPPADKGADGIGE